MKISAKHFGLAVEP